MQDDLRSNGFDEGVRVGTLYKLLGRTYIGECISTIVSENQIDASPARPVEKTMLWHQRMGHIGEKGLQDLHSKGMVEVSLIFH